LGSYMSTNTHVGAFMIGDRSVMAPKLAYEDNRYYARFANGYILYTSSDYTTGAMMYNGANSWSSISDSTKKERFRQTDGEATLRSFADLRLGSWNYRSQNPAEFRHYGPMAQEWFAAFGNDGIGTIGNDTTIASADVDGILCIAVQALEKRTAELRQTTAELRKITAEQRITTTELRKTTAELQVKSTELATVMETLTEHREKLVSQYVQMEELLARVSRLENALSNSTHTSNVVFPEQTSMIAKRQP
jgi:Mg2+ and Co2+ transporter CorA